MVFIGYYLIRAQAELERRMHSVGIDETEWLLEPVVIRKKEYDRSAWTPQDHSTQVKLAFLLNLASEYSNVTDFRSVFPTFEISTGFFEHWWSMESVDCLDLEELRVGNGILIDRTGHAAVDAWLDEIEGKRS